MYNELYHHGRLNQRWGVRNGPPYPLSRSTVQKAYKKKKGLAGYIQSRKEKKKAKAEKEAYDKLSEEEKKARYEADKQKALREGNATEVLKYVNDISNQELANAINRIKWTNELTKLSASELDKGWQNVNDIMKKVGNVKDWARTGVDLYKTIDEAMKLADQNKNKDKKVN